MRAVLVVDDEPGVLRLLDIVLGDLGCDLRLVSTAEDALAELEHSTPSVVLADIRLPGIDGIELAQRIHADTRLREAHVILMSAYGRPRGISGDEFVSKPFNLDALVEAVSAHAAS